MRISTHGQVVMGIALCLSAAAITKGASTACAGPAPATPWGTSPCDYSANPPPLGYTPAEWSDANPAVNTNVGVLAGIEWTAAGLRFTYGADLRVGDSIGGLLRIEGRGATSLRLIAAGFRFAPNDPGLAELGGYVQFSKARGSSPAGTTLGLHGGVGTGSVLSMVQVSGGLPLWPSPSIAGGDAVFQAVLVPSALHVCIY